MKWIFIISLAIALSTPALGDQDDTGQEPDQNAMTGGTPIDVLPDLREDDVPVDVGGEKEDRNWFAVPIPMSSPTFGTGLILGGAYYFEQTDEQKAVQPASFTGAALGYTTNESWFAGAMYQGYFAEDKWRVNALAAYADFKLELVPPPENSDEGALDWLVSGAIGQVNFERRLKGEWYLGASLRYLDIQQDFDLDIEDLPDFNLDQTIQSPGVGLKLEYDSRDIPSNPYDGRRLELRAVFADQQNVEEGSYQSYYARFRSYHRLSKPLVLAWEVNACLKDGRLPLWDTCRLTLRGFPITEYLSLQNVQTQAELRWNFWRRWGVVAFAGAGWVDESLGGYGQGETIPSYGVGIRWMVLESQRINVRVDYARSNNGNEAWYLSVAEAF